VEVTVAEEDRGCGGNPHSEDCAFRIFPKLNYRARRELRAFERFEQDMTRRLSAAVSVSKSVKADTSAALRAATAARLATLATQEEEQNTELTREVWRTMPGSAACCV